MHFECFWEHLLHWVFQERLTESDLFADLNKFQTSGKSWAAQAVHPEVFASGSRNEVWRAEGTVIFKPVASEEKKAYMGLTKSTTCCNFVH